MPTPTFSLPPLAAAPVSAETRLHYVLEHFALAYPGAPIGVIGYTATGHLVEIADLGEAFFGDTQPYPTTPNWREWQGRQIPFFFDDPTQKTLLFQEDKVIISADIISAAFYLLSGWQEYFSTERDQHGRFPYAASVQKKYGFVTLPVVNYYFDVLRTAVEHMTGQLLQPRRWGPQQAEFAAFISHDVDNLYSAWKAPAKAALHNGNPLDFGRKLWQHFTTPDAWDNLGHVQETVASYGAKSTFFFLPNSTVSANSTPNADYNIRRRVIKQQIKDLAVAGSEIGVHGSTNTPGDSVNLVIETGIILQILNQEFDSPIPIGNRFHYLKWEPSITPFVLECIPFNYDSTLGFAEHFGFRNSFCLPFYPFEFTKGRSTDFLEIPLNVMDATLHHPNYLQLAPSEILPALAPVFAEIKRFGGVASVLWHNQNFDPANTVNGPHQFHEIMAHLQVQGAAFCTGREIWEEFTAAPTQHS
jgi:hypothetical protein